MAGIILVYYHRILIYFQQIAFTKSFPLACRFWREISTLKAEYYSFSKTQEQGLFFRVSWDSRFSVIFLPDADLMTYLLPAVFCYRILLSYMCM